LSFDTFASACSRSRYHSCSSSNRFCFVVTIWFQLRISACASLEQQEAVAPAAAAAMTKKKKEKQKLPEPLETQRNYVLCGPIVNTHVSYRPAMADACRQAAVLAAGILPGRPQHVGTDTAIM
jgi:hypothetical protein